MKIILAVAIVAILPLLSIISAQDDPTVLTCKDVPAAVVPAAPQGDLAMMTPCTNGQTVCANQLAQHQGPINVDKYYYKCINGSWSSYRCGLLFNCSNTPNWMGCICV